MNESAVIESAKQGCHESFSRLVSAYYRPVVKQCLSIVGDPVEAEDLAQDVFLDVYIGLRTFRGNSKLSTWLYRVTANKAYRRLRDMGRRGIPVDNGGAEPHGDVAPDDESAMAANQELRYLLQRLIESLPPLLRETIHLRLLGYTYTEIARMHQCPPETVKTRVRRAIALMRQEA